MLAARLQKAREENEGGFTLIELLVVMIIIGILAAIAIPVFLSQRAKAQDSAAKADVSTLGKEVAAYWVDGSTAPTITGPANGSYTVGGQNAGKVSKNTSLTSQTGTTATATAWCVGVTNTEGSQKTFKYTAAAGLEPGAC